ncbi:hypothetical protein [Burkholderia pseudomallei]|uniref:hypothetical protein n=1 Tax=Burkholderia pseudomallei TaxID=28450 RepID=UPI00126A3843|nr:hypothetical protein [Burkholderia pseudomallei]
MISTQQSLSSALTALGNTISGLGQGLLALAGKAASAQSTADAAIPESQAGTAPGDMVVFDAQGRLPAVDGSQLTNFSSPHGILPVLTIELGHGAYGPT